jgi:hypothetical protein
MMFGMEIVKISFLLDFMTLMQSEKERRRFHDVMQWQQS